MSNKNVLVLVFDKPKMRMKYFDLTDRCWSKILRKYTLARHRRRDLENGWEFNDTSYRYSVKKNPIQKTPQKVAQPWKIKLIYTWLVRIFFKSSASQSACFTSPFGSHKNMSVVYVGLIKIKDVRWLCFYLKDRRYLDINTAS